MSSRGSDIETKVVELSFQNSQFEQNAKTSISTLDRLKNALDMSKNAKIFDEIDKGVKKVNVGALSSGIETLSGKLNSLKSIAVFSMIADEAIKAKNAVEGFVKSVTLDQVSAGFDKYAEKTSAVQTIMAATAKEYSSTEEQMADVNAQLEKLNWFTDETSYSFLDMVNNIGKFTSNNIKLDTSVTAMQGISTWAAVSGAKIEEAGRAMYNLSQAVATGAVKLMDWKSIENANMATAEFKETALETAATLGTLKKEADGTFKTIEKGTEVSVSGFNQTLSEGWFTSDVLLQTLEKYGGFTDELYGLMEKVNGDATTSEVLEFLDQYKEGSIDFGEASKEMGMSVSQLKTEFAALSDDALNLGIKAFKAAQEAKTFGEAVDSVKDAVSTGWMNTFETLFGDYTEAKVLWTDLANNLYTIFAEGGNARNELLQEAFEQQSAINESDWQKLVESGIASPEFVSAVKQAASVHDATTSAITSNEAWLQNALRNSIITLDDLDAAYKKVFGGETTGAKVDENVKKLVDSALESDEAFGTLLETLKQYDGEDVGSIIFGDGKIAEGTAGELEKSIDEVIKTLGLTQDQGDALVGVLQSMGYLAGSVKEAFEGTDSTIEGSLTTTEALDEKLGKTAKSASEAERIMEEIRSGHMTTGELWVDTLQIGMRSLVDLFDVAKKAWENVFPPMSADTITDIVVSIHSAISSFSEFVKTNKTLKLALEGVFSIVSIVKDVLLTIGSTILGSIQGILDGLGINVESLIANVSNLIIKFRDWISTSGALQAVSNFVINSVTKAAQAVRGWINSFLNLPFVNRTITNFGNGFKSLGKQLTPFFDGMKERVEQFKERLAELDGIKLDNINDVFAAFKETIWEYFVNFPGFNGLKAAFNTLKADVKMALKSIGINTDALSATWEKFKSKFDPTSLIPKLTNILTKVKELKESFMELPVVQSAVSNLKNGIYDFTSNIGTWFTETKDKFVEWFDKIRNMDGFDIQNIGSAIKSLWDILSNQISNLPGLDSVKQAFVDFKDGVKEQLIAMGIDLDKYKDKVTGFVESVLSKLGLLKKKSNKDLTTTGALAEKFGEADEDTTSIISNVFNTLKDFFDRSKEEINGPAEETAGILENFGNAVAKAFSAIEPFIAKIYTWVRPIAMLAGAFMIFKSLKSLEHIIRPETIKKQGSGFKDAATGILMISGSIYILAQALKLIESLEVEKLPQTLGIISGLALGLVLVAKALSEMDGLFNSGVGVALIVASMYLLLGLFKVLDSFTLKDPSKVTVTFLTMVGALAAIFLATRAAGKNAAAAGSAALLSSVAILIIAGALKVLETIDDKNIGKVVGITMLIAGVLAALIAVSQFATGSALVIAGIAATIFILATALADLAAIDPDGLVRARDAIGLCLAAVALVAFASGSMTNSLGAMVLLTIIIGLISLALYELVKLDADGAMKVSLSLAALFGSLAILMGVLTLVGTFGTAALIGLGEMAAVVVAIGVVAGLIGALVHYFPQLEEFLNNGLEILINIAEGVGRFFGALVGGFADQAASYLPGIAESLVGFVEGLQPLNGMEGINFDVLLDALGAIIAIDFTELVDGIISGVTELTTGQTAVGLFSANLQYLSTALSDWQTKMEGIDEITIPSGAIAKLTGMIMLIDVSSFVDAVSGIVSQMLTGQTPVEQFATNLDTLSTALSGWKEKLEGIKTITVPTDAITSLVSSLKQISMGSLFTTIADWVRGAFTQENQTAVEEFKTKTATLATALSDWQTKMEEIGDITVPEDAISKLTIAIDSIPTSGLLESIGRFITGSEDNSVNQFAGKITALGVGIKGFSDALGTDFDTNKISQASETLTVLSALGNTLKGQNFDGFFSKGDYSNFADALTETLAPALEEFSQIDVDSAKIKEVGAGASALARAASSFSKIKLSESELANAINVTEFKTNIDNLAASVNGLAGLDDSGVSKFKTAVESISQMDISGAMSKINEEISKQEVDLTTTGENAGNTLAAGISSKSEYVSAVIGIVIEAAKRTAENVSSSFASVGSSYTSSLASGISSNSYEASSAAGSVASDAQSEADGYSDEFVTVGTNLMQGLANGINSGKSKVVEAIVKAVTDAINAGKKKAGIASPSKVMYEVGKFFTMGFANGISDYTGSAVKSSSKLAESSIEGMKEAIKTAKDILGSDLDGDPVIRPVLDLSEVRSGSRALQNLMGLNRPVRLAGDLGTINANSLAIRNRATNDDLYSAFMELKNDPSIGGNTYNVNGITYDDGSNVATAVKSLIHAARVERRS